LNKFDFQRAMAASGGATLLQLIEQYTNDRWATFREHSVNIL
jgi:hypothetical protein